MVAASELEIGTYLLTMETPLACDEANLLETERRLEIFEVRKHRPASTHMRVRILNRLAQFYAITNIHTFP